MSLDINLTGVEKTSNKKTTLTDNSDTFYPTQKAVKTAVDAKFNTPTGTTAQYLRGDGTTATFPTIPTAVTKTSDLTNDGEDGVNPFITALDIPTAGQAGTLVREVKNMTGATLTKGTVVFISGANGNKPLVTKALATSDALSSRTFGLLQSNILNNGVGYCVVIGDLSGLDTSAFTEGAQLYLSGTVAGTYTDTKTLAPTHLVYVGKVTRSHPTQGQIEVQIQNGYELNEIHDVAISTPLNNQSLVYETATTLWKNKALTTAEVADSSNKRYQTDAQKTDFTNPKITVECIDALTVDFYAMYTFQIDSVTAITNSPTTTILVNDLAYTFGVSIAIGAKITVTLNTAGVVNLNTTRL